MRRHQPEALLRLMRSVARNVSTEASLTGLAADAGGQTPLARSTATAYLRALERIFMVEAQPAWSVQMRSRATLRKTPKIHFVDPSLAASALRATPQRLLKDVETLDLLFESPGLSLGEARSHFKTAETLRDVPAVRGGGVGAREPGQRQAAGRREHWQLHGSRNQ